MAIKNNITIQCKDLIEELHFDSLSLEKQEELIMKMSEVIYDRAILKVLEVLTGEESVQLTKFLGEAKEKEAGDFLSEKVPGFDDIIKKEIMDFQQEIIQAVK